MTDKTDKTNRVKEITDKLHDSVKALFESDKYKAYLSCMGKFHNYSFNNTLLIAQQRPDASLAAGYKAWSQKFGRHVVEGAKGIQIVLPSPWKKKEQVAVKAPDGSTVMKDGKPVTEEVERIMPGFKIGYVYAYEDTEGTPLPSITDICDRKVANIDGFLDALKTVSPVPISYEHLNSSANGYYSLTDRQIHVEESLPELQKIKTTIHEIGHAIMHDMTEGTDHFANRREREVEAESVAYTVCSYYGLDTSDYSFGYIAGWSENKSLKELEAKMTLIKDTSGIIIDGLDTEFLKVRMSEKGELAYKNGQEYFYMNRQEDGYSYSVYNLDLKELYTGMINDADMPIDKAAKAAMKQAGFMDTFASLYDTGTLKNNITKAYLQKLENQKPAPETAMTEKAHYVRHR